MTLATRWPLAGAALLLAATAVLWALAQRPGAGPEPAAPALDWQDALADAPDAGFAPPSGPWRLDLPADHGAHPEARTETWSVAAQLRGPEGETVGVQFALLRAALAPPGEASEASWDMSEAWRGHVVLTDGQSAAGEERLHRALAGVAGADAEAGELRLDHWSLRYGGEDTPMRLRAAAGGAAVELTLLPVKRPLASGDGEGPFRGYAVTRMEAEGWIERDGARVPVTGLAWLDHLWGEVPLPVGPVVWDRLQLQLDDGTDVSVTRTRRRDGSGTPQLSGFAVDAEGRVADLDGVTLEDGRDWRQNDAGGAYRLDWRLSAGDMSLEVEPVVDDQAHDFLAPVWSGTVTAAGRNDGTPVAGTGAMLLSGTAR